MRETNATADADNETGMTDRMLDWVTVQPAGNLVILVPTPGLRRAVIHALQSDPRQFWDSFNAPSSTFVRKVGGGILVLSYMAQPERLEGALVDAYYIIDTTWSPPRELYELVERRVAVTGMIRQ